MASTRSLALAASSLTLADDPNGPLPEAMVAADNRTMAVAIGCLLRMLDDDEVMSRLSAAPGLGLDISALSAWFADPTSVTIYPHVLTRLLLVVAGRLAYFIEADHGCPASIAAAEAFDQAYRVMPKAA